MVKQLSAWKKAGHDLYPVSINFSSNQLSDLGYVDFLEELLKRYDVSPRLLEVEITESIFVDKTLPFTAESRTCCAITGQIPMG